MKELLAIDGWKLKFMFLASSIFFMLMALIIFAIAFINDAIPDLKLTITILLSASLAIPLFILLLVFLRGTWDLHKRSSALRHSIFSELLKNGFSEKLKKEHDKWNLSELVLEGELDGFSIIAEVDTQNDSNIVRVQALTLIKALGKDEMRRLDKIFRAENIEFDFKGITKKINIKNNTYYSSAALFSDLKRFTSLLNKEGFQPISAVVKR